MIALCTYILNTYAIIFFLIIILRYLQVTTRPNLLFCLPQTEFTSDRFYDEIYIQKILLKHIYRKWYFKYKIIRIRNDIVFLHNIMLLSAINTKSSNTVSNIKHSGVAVSAKLCFWDRIVIIIIVNLHNTIVNPPSFPEQSSHQNVLLLGQSLSADIAI